MQIEGWCYKHNCPLHMVPIAGSWEYLCPECLKEIRVYSVTNVAEEPRKDPIRDMMVNGVKTGVSMDA